MAFRDRIFQKFSQADGSDARQKGGTGLGLAISKELVERLGGRIGFESVEGQGTCFFVELPRCSATLPAWPDATASGFRPRILAVDDDVDMARMLAQMLARAGYAVDCATSGAEALSRLAQGGYAAMTLDLQLPDMTGQALIERLRADPATAGLPVLVISARMEEVRAALTERVAGVEFIAKPIDQPGLLASLSRLLAPTDHAHPRVLHVEDDTGLHRVVRAMAGDRFDFELATTLREARTRVALERFDVVILDLTLPNESGWDLLPDLHARQPGTRVVVLTGAEMSELDSHRVDAVLRKGQVSPQELLDAINGPAFSDSRNTL
jgi:DNA-binding response OmpR family regulator